MEPIKIQVEVGISEEAKNFLTGLVEMLAEALKGQKPVKKATSKEKPAEVKEEPAPVDNEPVAPENEEDAPVYTREDARLAVNEARERGIDQARIKACLPNGKQKVTDLTQDELKEFIKKVKEL